MENFILTISYLIIGMGLRRLAVFPDNTSQVLNLFVIYVSLPALVLLKVPGLTLGLDLLHPVLMPWIMLIISAAIILVLAKALSWPRDITGTLLLLVPLGNTSFLGIPMVRVFFGEEGIPFALLYDQFGSFLGLATFGTAVLALYGEGETRPTVSSVIKKIVTFPPFVSLILALFLRSVDFPSSLTLLLQTLASTLVPVVMIAVGFQLTLRLSRDVLTPFGLGLGIKLVVAPVLALLFCRLFGFDTRAAQVAVFEAGMPPMVSAGALAMMAGLSPRLTAALVGMGILLSFATLPLLHRLIML